MLRYLLFSLLLVAGTLSAQSIPQEREQAMPYPVTNAYDTPQTRDFAADFEVTDVGNLHVYDPELATGTSREYMMGTAIAPANYRYLPGKLKGALSSGQKAYAVHAIRGEGESYFLVRHPAVKGVELGLYRFDGEEMQHLLDLAGYQCKEDRCAQMDSWIIDLDGDTRLDVVQKIKKGNRPAKMRVYQQTDKGSFRRNRTMRPDPETYPLQVRE